MKTPAIDTNHARYILKDGIMYITWHHGIVINIDVAKELVEERVQLCTGKAKLILIDINGLSSVDTAARKFLASEHAIAGITAGALLVGSLISKLAGSVYIKVDKPGRPIKLFTDKAKAIKWLKQQINQAV